MIEYNAKENCLKIRIPNSNLDELSTFRKSILRILSRIEIDNTDSSLKKDLKSVYELLSHLQPDEASLAKIKGTFQELDQSISKN